MSTNYISKLVSITTTLTFDQMGTLQELLELAAMESVEGGDALKSHALCDLANALDIDLDVDSMESAETTAVVGNEGNDQDDNLPESPHQPEAD